MPLSRNTVLYSILVASSLVEEGKILLPRENLDGIDVFVELLSRSSLGIAQTIGGSKGEGHPSSFPGGPNSFNFMQLLGKFGKIVCWRPPPGELAPPTQGNPGSATALSPIFFNFMQL